jgi:hypothetical protein
MKEDFYATIKLKSGEEIFAKINYNEDNDRCFLILDNPITIERIKTRTTSGYKVEPWIKTSKEELFVINMDDIMTLSESKDLETITMHQTFSIQQNSFHEKKTKLDRKMGYISTISEAKKSLEKLFKDN